MCQKAIEDCSQEIHRNLVSQVAHCLICAKTLPSTTHDWCIKGTHKSRADTLAWTGSIQDGSLCQVKFSEIQSISMGKEIVAHGYTFVRYFVPEGCEMYLFCVPLHDGFRVMSTDRAPSNYHIYSR